MTEPERKALHILISHALDGDKLIEDNEHFCKYSLLPFEREILREAWLSTMF